MKQTEKSAVRREPPDAPPGTRRAWLWGAWLWGAGLVLLVAVVYWPTLDCGFVSDDEVYVKTNVALESLPGLGNLWFKLGTVEQYYPLVFSTFWVEFHLWGLDPRGYHVVNVLLHAIAAVLVWRLLARLEVPGAWLAGAIFAVHPVEVESVAWISERKNVLSCALALGSLLAYLRFSPAENSAATGARLRGRWQDYVLAFVLYVAALLSKSVTASVPAVLLVIFWWKRGRVTWRDAARLAPFFAVGLAVAGLTVWMEKTYVGATGETWDLSVVERLLIAGRAVWFYAGKLFWPNPLIFYYPRWTIDSHVWWQYLFPLAALALLVGLWLSRNRIGRGPLAAALIFGGVLTPALGFFDVYPFRYSFVADHYQYHAGIALVALSAASTLFVLSYLSKPARWLAPVAGALLLLPLALTAYERTHVFKDDQALNEDILAKDPQSWAAHNNLALPLLQQGKHDEAMARFRKSIQLIPGDPVPRNNLALILISQQRFDEAAAELHLALACDATNFERTRTFRFLGIVQMEQNRFDEALVSFNKAIELNPNSSGPYLYRGRIRAIKGDIPAALVDVERSLKLQPGAAETLELHASLLARTGKYAEALADLDALRKTMPDNPNLLLQIAALYQNSKQWHKAVAAYDQLLTSDPQNVAAYRGRADSLVSLGKQERAIADYKAVLKIEPENIEVLNNLAWILATSPDGKLRDGWRAIELGRAASEATEYKRADILSTLAAGYAETGNFEAAITWSKKALEFDDEQLKGELTRQLESYQAQKPWREALPPADGADLNETPMSHGTGGQS